MASIVIGAIGEVATVSVSIIKLMKFCSAINDSAAEHDVVTAKLACMSEVIAAIDSILTKYPHLPSVTALRASLKLCKTALERELKHVNSTALRANSPSKRLKRIGGKVKWVLDREDRALLESRTNDMLNKLQLAFNIFSHEVASEQYRTNWVFAVPQMLEKVCYIEDALMRRVPIDPAYISYERCLDIIGDNLLGSPSQHSFTCGEYYFEDQQRRKTSLSHNWSADRLGGKIFHIRHRITMRHRLRNLCPSCDEFLGPEGDLKDFQCQSCGLDCIIARQQSYLLSGNPDDLIAQLKNTEMAVSNIRQPPVTEVTVSNIEFNCRAMIKHSRRIELAYYDTLEPSQELDMLRLMQEAWHAINGRVIISHSDGGSYFRRLNCMQTSRDCRATFQDKLIVWWFPRIQLQPKIDDREARYVVGFGQYWLDEESVS